MKFAKLPIALLISTTLLSACGGSSSSSSNNSGSALKQGQFIDSPVQGLNYTRSGLTTKFRTLANGIFIFKPTELLQFSVGDIPLGSAQTDTSTRFVTPSVLAKGDEQTRVNIARFLLTLDDDQDPTNGITISPTVQLAALSYTGTADFSQLDNSDLAQFAQTANGGDSRPLISADAAARHLNASEADIADGGFDGDGGGDADLDGVSDANDRCPETSAGATVDTRGCTAEQGIGDADEDGILNENDNCPSVANPEQFDFDKDELGDKCDDDADGDGVKNDDETDTDPLNPDSDSDGTIDGDDNCPALANPDQADFDEDGLGDLCDPDQDNDGVLNEEDAFPFNKDEATDTDGDGVGDNSDNCPDTANTDQADFDDDGMGDSCDSDQDNDGTPNGSDAFPFDATETSDTDLDGVGDNADEDDDNDNVLDTADYCPQTPPESTVINSNGTGASTQNGCTTEQISANYCADGKLKTAGASYQQLIPSPNLASSGDPLTVSFEVFEPGTIDCSKLAAGAHPLILHGHGFGGSRTTSAGSFQTYLDQGYTVISIDQRGFGDSSGTIRVMDPKAEGEDLTAILDWAETNLYYTAWRNDSREEFTTRPTTGTSEADGDNIVVGAIGGSYGGGYQLLLLAVDEKNRLDALAPDIAWHDLRFSLNPGDTIKTGWDLALVAGGESASYQEGMENNESPTDRGLDPFVKETLAQGVATNEFPREALKWFNYHSPSFWCANQGATYMPYKAAAWDQDPNAIYVPESNEPNETPVAGSVDRQLPPVDVLLTQGFRDTLFNFNDAWWNYQCLSSLGGDVRLYTHQSGHILGVAASNEQQPSNSGAPITIPGFQDGGGKQACGSTSLAYTGGNNGFVLNWFNSKLKRQDIDTGSNDLCLSLADDDAVNVAAENFIAPGGNEAAYTRIKVSADNIANGALAAATVTNGPTVIELAQINSEHGAILAGIPTLSVVISTADGAARSALQDCSPPQVPTLRTGCDSIVFVGIGQQIGGEGYWDLVDDQIYPLRGLGEHNVNLNGIAERISQGDKLALLVYGYHPQFPASFSRDETIAAVNLRGQVDLPLYAATAEGKIDLDNGGSTTFNPCGNPEADASGSVESLHSGSNWTDFENLDKDRDGCVQGYSFARNASVDVVRKDEQEVRDANTSVFNLDVPEWLSYVKCAESMTLCSANKTFVEVGNFDDDADNEIRAELPSVQDGINSLQWKPNRTAAAVGFNYAQLGGATQPLMRVEFATDSAIGDQLVRNVGGAEPITLQQDDKIIAVLWHQTGKGAGLHEVNFFNAGQIADIHLYLLRDGASDNFYRKGGLTSLQDFDPTTMQNSPGWLAAFISEWKVKEIAFDTGFTTGSEALIIDDVEMIIHQP
ncbi:thrombospondin type 3 repeat-containing protein [Zhongshania sp.]|uniref:thrombospondin type 3 repeat-containing protein n=1 Tax=Zhongshania sp. TaxID=1971902 RepID=UPI003565FA40